MICLSSAGDLACLRCRVWRVALVWVVLWNRKDADNSVLPMKSHASDVTTSLDRKIHLRIFHERRLEGRSNKVPIFQQVNHIKISVKPLRHWNRHAGRISLWRHLRSKIWWFAEFCNSHCLSHFAAFFIGMGTKTSIVENFLFLVVVINLIIWLHSKAQHKKGS